MAVFSGDKSFNSLDFSNANFELLSSLFENVDWVSMFEHSPNSFASDFHDKVLSICLENVPVKSHLTTPIKRKNTGNNARKKRRLLARLFALKQYNPTSASIPALESKLLEFEQQKKDQVFKLKLKKELKCNCKHQEASCYLLQVCQKVFQK